jgi:hypothetical protein
MKLLSKSPLFISMALAITSNAWSLTNEAQLPADIEYEIIEGKISAVEEFQNQAALKKSLDEKQLKVIKLINVVGRFANNHSLTESAQNEASYAYGGFIARFQGIREDREVLEKKGALGDDKTLQNCSQRLDRLISDVKKFLNVK